MQDPLIAYPVRGVTSGFSFPRLVDSVHILIEWGEQVVVYILYLRFIKSEVPVRVVRNCVNLDLMYPFMDSIRVGVDLFLESSYFVINSLLYFWAIVGLLHTNSHSP